MNKKNEIGAIKSAIQEKGFNWEPVANNITALSDEERMVLLGYKPGPNDMTLEEQERVGTQNFIQYMASSSQAGFSAFGAPAAIDWRNVNGQNYVTPVISQGGCGSCVAFGTIASVESKIKIQRGANFAVNLSEAHLFYCIARSQGRNCGRNNDPAGGWWPEAAMIAFRDLGVTDEVCYPYNDADQNCSGRTADWASHLTKISDYTKLNGIPAIKDWIANNGPVNACFTVYDDFYYVGTGVYHKTSNVLRGGHCVCLIGYSDVEQCWIAKNSWGPTFGSNGFFKIGYGEVGIEGQVYAATSVIDNYALEGKKVVGLWANNENRNAWAYISDTGWRKINNNNDVGFANTLTELAAAKASNATVNLYFENGLISTTYVF